MADTFLYKDLDLEGVRTSFEIHSEVLVSLSPHHAVACIELIKLIERAENLRFNRFRWFRRTVFIAGAPFRTLRFAVCNGRLFFLCPLLILSPVSKDWEQLPDGSFLFRFTRTKTTR